MACAYPHCSGRGWHVCNTCLLSFCYNCKYHPHIVLEKDGSERAPYPGESRKGIGVDYRGYTLAEQCKEPGCNKEAQISGYCSLHSQQHWLMTRQ